MMNNGQSVLEKISLYSTLSLRRQREGHLSMWRQALEMLAVALDDGQWTWFLSYGRPVPSLDSLARKMPTSGCP